MDFNKMKNFCSSKTPLRKWKARYNWQKIFAIHIYGKELVSRKILTTQ